MATEDANTPEEAVEAGDLGKLLKEYRESASLNIEQISDALCLSPSSIKALEEEAFERLPEAPYVRGYLRHYAGVTSRDPQPLVDTYNKLRGESTSSIPEPMISESYRETSKPLITPMRYRLGLFTSLLILLGVLTMIPAVRDWTSNLWSSFSSDSDITTTNEDDVAADAIAGLPSLTDEVAGNLPIANEEEVSADKTAESEATQQEAQTDTTTETQPAEKTTEEEAVAKTETPQAEAAPAADPASNKKAPEDATKQEQKATNETATSEIPANTPDSTVAAEGNTKLKLIFKDEVWIRIKGENGKIAYEALHPAGSEKELSLNSPLKFKVGNAPGMALFVNGKEMDVSQFTKGSVAKFGIE